MIGNDTERDREEEAAHARARECGSAQATGESLDPLITIPQAAREMGVGVRQVRRAVKSGDLPSYRVGEWPRVRRSDLGIWIRGLRVKATSHARLRAEEVLRRGRESE